VKARHATISGGYYRVYEVLKNGKSEGINYVVVTDSASYQNYVNMFPNFIEILKQYKTYRIDLKENMFSSSKTFGLKAAASYFESFLTGMYVSKIARKENVDIIVGPSEGAQMVLVSFFAGCLSRRPWTAIFQGTSDLLQPSLGLAPLNPVNILKHINQKESTKRIPFISRLGFGLELLTLLKIAEKSLILSVSHSVCQEIKFLNPKIRFYIVDPGNGVDLKKFSEKPKAPPLYDAVFFSRLIPEKGLLDLPEIWKLVVQKFPRAILAVAGTIEDSEVVEAFMKEISQYGLTENVKYLGPQDKDSIVSLVKSSKLTVYPSVLDSFGLVILESLACGVPVIAYDTLAVKYNFSNCKAVLQCPLKDKASIAENVKFLLGDESIRDKLSMEAKIYAKNFDWKKVIQAEKEAYFKVIEWFMYR
jgi:glycosyltransferase involved in cell wall biosynthesis